MTTQRRCHSATTLSNGNVLVTGGEIRYGAPHNSCELYNAIANKCNEIANMGTGRSYHTMSTIGDDDDDDDDDFDVEAMFGDIKNAAKTK